MKEHKQALQYSFMVALHEAVACHAVSGSNVSFDSLIDSKKRDMFKRHIATSFEQIARKRFKQNPHLGAYSEEHVALLNNVIKASDTFIDEKQNALSQADLLLHACQHLE
ncbi:MAG: hypothetical protein ACLFNM_03935 [Candidatus Woesearchaeota archaeon]